MTVSHFLKKNPTPAAVGPNAKAVPTQQQRADPKIRPCASEGKGIEDQRELLRRRSNKPLATRVTIVRLLGSGTASGAPAVTNIEAPGVVSQE